MHGILLVMGLIIGLTLSAAEQSFWVMSYNIRYDNPADGPDRWDDRKQELVDLILKSRPEILGVQEAMHHQANYLDSMLTDYTFVGVGRDDGRTEGEYSAIFFDSTRITCTFNHTFWLTENPTEMVIGWDAAIKRICTYGAFQHRESGKQFWVFNTHFDHVGVTARLESARLISRVVHDVSGPVVLLGDFNLTPDEEPIQILTTGLSDTFTATQNEHIGPEGTWNGFDPTAAIERRIDYIFVRDFAVHSHVHFGMRRLNNRHFSDHLPVLSQIAFE